MFLVKFLFNVVFRHCIFFNEGIGVFLQLVGFAMGTNYAPVWAQLILRMFELRKPLPKLLLLFRFINDDLLFHPISVGLSSVRKCLSLTHRCI